MTFGKTFFRTLVASAVALAIPSAAMAVDIPLPGKIGIVTNNKKTGEDKLNKFTAKAPKSGPTFAIPAPSSADDPTIAGGTFSTCVVGDSCGSPILLPASGWKGLGKPAGSKGYKYKGDGSLTDPCKSVVVKPKVISATCKGAGSQPNPFVRPIAPDSVTNRLSVGSVLYCTRFDPPFTKDDAAKLIWKDKNAPAPASCPGAASPTPSPTPAPTPTPPSYGSASHAFLTKPAGLL